MSEDDVNEFVNKVCPTCGSCSGMYTANSMNCLTEALGMGLGGNGTIPAVYSERIRLAKHAGMAVMELLRKGITARQIMTKEAVLNALTVDMALGCSTNSMLHLPAIAHEIDFDFDIADANPISERTPNLCHLAPAGPTYMEDLNEAGGVYAVMKQLADAGLINTECMTVTGKTIGEHKGFWFHTIGQRKGLGLSGGPWYVVKKNVHDNVIYVSNGYDTEQQYGNELHLDEMHFITADPWGSACDNVEITFKNRHMPEFIGGRLTRMSDSGYRIVSDRKVQGIAPGQFAVIYDKDSSICYGSGIITGRNIAK